ncbi:hypothetical protein [uncultured Mycobacterium sp.]
MSAAGDLAPVWRANLSQIGTFDPFAADVFLDVPDQFARRGKGRHSE